MNICMVYQGEYPFYERIYKEAKALSEEGHNVTLLCNNYGRFGVDKEVVDNISITRIKPNLSNSKLAKIIKFPIFLNPLWIYSLYKTVKMYNIDILHVIDIPLSICAIKLGRFLNIPVVLDLWSTHPRKSTYSDKLFSLTSVSR